MGPAPAGLVNKRFSERDDGRAPSVREATLDQQPQQPSAALQLGASARPPELQPGAAAAAATPAASPGTATMPAGRRKREVHEGHSLREPAAALGGQSRQQPSLESAAEPPWPLQRGTRLNLQEAWAPPGALLLHLWGSWHFPQLLGAFRRSLLGAFRRLQLLRGPLREQQDKEAPGSRQCGRPRAPVSADRRAQEQLTPWGSAAAPVPATAPAAKEATAERPPREQQDEKAPASQQRARLSAPISAVQRAQDQLMPRGSPAAPAPAATPAAREDRRADSGRASPSGSKGLRSLPLASASLVREKPESAAAGMRQPGDADSSARPAEAGAAEAPQERDLREATAAKPKRGDVGSSTALARRQSAENPRAWQLPEAGGAASQPGNAGSSTDISLSAGPVPSAGVQSYKSTTARALLAKLRGVQQLGI